MKTSIAATRLRQIKAQRRQLVQSPTAKTLPPGVTKRATSATEAKKPTAKNDGRDAVFNAHKVPADKWKKWDGTARRAYNNLFSFMMRNARLFYHPDSKHLPMHEWNTTAHNAAWIAADAARGRYSGDEMGTDGNATYIEPDAVRKARAAAKAKAKASEKAKTKTISTKAKAGRITRKK